MLFYCNVEQFLAWICQTTAEKTREQRKKNKRKGAMEMGGRERRIGETKEGRKMRRKKKDGRERGRKKGRHEKNGNQFID